MAEKFKYPIFYLQVHFRSTQINGDGSIRKIADELLNELKSLSASVQEQVHSIQHSLAQIDTYQQVSLYFPNFMH